MLCSRCKKRQAVVFITGTDGQNSESAGLCLTCAKELGVPRIEEMIKEMGLSEDNIRDLEDRFNDMFDAARHDDDDYDDGLEDDFDDDEEIAPFFSMNEDMFMNDEDFPDGEDEEEKNGENDDQDDGEDNDQPPPRPLSPLQRMFGGAFEPGGAATRGERNRRRKKGKRSQNTRYLNDYCQNLTQKAREGKIDRIVGRDNEIERMVQILSRRSKNNPCLIGEPGVGKTAVVEGLALRMASGDVPARLRSKSLYLMDLTALVAGTQFRGQFESRMKGLIDEVRKLGNVILFIDEVHTLVGTGDAEGSMNAANIMKPALSRGELQVIGATTFNEYRKNIEKDAALERRFQPIKVDEPSVSETISVLEGIKDYYENYHNVTVSKAMIARMVQLSERYITDRFLPDKAIDLLDETCACAALRNKPRQQAEEIEAKTAALKQQLEEMEQNEPSPGDENDYYRRRAELSSEIQRLELPIPELMAEAEKLKNVTESDIAHVIELWTGIQASKVEQSDYDKLSGLDRVIKEKVIGQDEAVDLVCAAIRRSRVQISPRRRPASFIFVGPTGVGKTELVKVLASELFSSPETLIRLDMSEFMEKHSVSKIIGSPPGYVGYDEAGQLTEKVRRKPYSIILFDEIEKAHPDVLNILLQILDEGHINDSQGRTVNFENTVIVMTSNAGSEKKDSGMGFGRSEQELSKEKALSALREFLRPEFIARVDEVVAFNPLSDEDFVRIARLMISEYESSLAERGMTLTVTDAAARWLADNSRDGKSAARDLRNLIRREVEDKLTQLIIDRMNNVPEQVTVDVENGQIVIK